MTAYRHLFGPVPSRRLGRSLGVDLVPAKTCSANCVFCQLGRTARPAVARREYVPTGEVLRELADLEKCGACSVLWGPGNRERVGIGEYLCRECGGKPEEDER